MNGSDSNLYSSSLRCHIYWIICIHESCSVCCFAPQVVVLLRPLVLRDVLHALSVGECVVVAWDFLWPWNVCLPKSLTSDSKREGVVNTFENIIVIILHTVQWPEDDRFNCLIPAQGWDTESQFYIQHCSAAEPDHWHFSSFGRSSFRPWRLKCVSWKSGIC